ncbi:PaaI family thioesterase [Mariniphaga sediminis]|uniref:PaaI family thioesterase n=1 Tax=Mariniphaga sediminis TaxID=1628158 RepID=A0A399CTY0_9BACT|nr:PaaI family thioesterase [Mariniphaga sediminis]RIH63345.1 PaaI family thioesterase [Mariniphaga sediminis]
MDITLLNLNTPLEFINQAMKKSLIGNLGIEFVKIAEGLVEGFLPLSEKNSRPDGILHGGANLAFAETLAGLGSMLLVDLKEFDVLGTQVSGNHTGILSEGKALGEAKIIHRGNKTHIWNVDVKNEEGRLISTVRVTNMIVKRND